MEKWADYLISGVIFSHSCRDRYISKLQVQKDKGKSVGPEKIWSRQRVIKKIDQGHSFITIYQTDEDTWSKGDYVEKIEIKSQTYLRTDYRKIDADNLGLIINKKFPVNATNQKI